MNIIEVENLTKIYKGPKANGEIKALDNFSLSVSKGEIFGLLGANGAGKTTLIKVLLGIVHPTFGSAKIFGKDITDFSVRSKIGFLPESHKFPTYLTAEEVLYYFAELSGVEKNVIKQRAAKYLSLVRIEKWKKTKVKQFSKGMMQRLGLAQAMMNDPELIFLDEPTDGIDPLGRKEIRDILSELKEDGKTIFLNSHLLSEVEMISTTVGIMKTGKLLQYGKVEDLTTDKEVYIIETATPVNTGLLPSSFDNISIKVESPVKIIVNVKDSLELNFVIDHFRKNGVIIKNVSQKKETLEELFLSLVANTEGGEE
jgi:ABC-2 type transport system ATP-binding protein